MIYHECYRAVPPEVVDEFLRGCTMGRLVTVTPEGLPAIGLYPYVRTAEGVELHLVRADSQVADLRARDRCLFECDEILSAIPPKWAKPADASSADQYYCAAVLDCRATVVEDPSALAAHLTQLLAKQVPGELSHIIAADDAVYAKRLSRLVLVRLAAASMKVKFKLGQQEPDALRRTILGHIRRRDTETDRLTARRILMTSGTY